MAIFMKFGDIKGESEVSGYEGWGELLHISWGFRRFVTVGVGTSAKREARAPQVSDLSCVARASAFTAQVSQAFVRSTEAKVVVHVTREARGIQHVPFQIYTLEKAAVVRFASDDTREAMKDSFAVVFGRIDSEFFDMSAPGTRTSTGHIVHDLAAAARGGT